MNLFRSEEHARNWTLFDADFEIYPLSHWLERFSAEGFRARSCKDCIS